MGRFPSPSTGRTPPKAPAHPRGCPHSRSRAVPANAETSQRHPSRALGTLENNNHQGNNNGRERTLLCPEGAAAGAGRQARCSARLGLVPPHTTSP